MDRMFDEAHHVSELATSSSRQMHGSFEMHVSIAEWSQKGDVTVYNSSQCPSLSSQYFSKLLQIPEAQIRVITNYVGGGFGGKATSKFNIDFLSIIAAKKLGPPVKFYYDREEEFLLGTHRTKQFHVWRIATDKDGMLLARDTRMVVGKRRAIPITARRSAASRRTWAGASTTTRPIATTPTSSARTCRPAARCAA